MSVQIYVMPSLQKVLEEKGIESYTPAYGNESAGLDLYYVGEEPLTMKHLDKPYLVPTGLKVRIPNGFVGLILDRGSISKTPLVRRAGVVDCGYTGEIFVNLVTLSAEYNIIPGTKLPVQLVVVPCDNQFVSVTKEVYEEESTASVRQAGKVGSSDK